MKSFFRHLSSRFPVFANRPSALERAVRQSPKSRRLRMEPLENRALLAVDAFGGAASLLDSDVGESWGPDPAPAAFSASELATDAAVIDLSAVDATLDDASFSVRTETPEPVAPPSFEQLMESLGMIEIELLDDESDVASSSCLDDATDATAATSDAVVRRVVFEGSEVDAESLDDPTVIVPLATVDNAIVYNNLQDDASVTVNGSTDLDETGGYAPSGGAATSYCSFTVPDFGSRYVIRVECLGGGAISGQDYMFATAEVGDDGEFTPLSPINNYAVASGGSSGGGWDISGGSTYCIVPINDEIVERSVEEFTINFYRVDTYSGGENEPDLPCGTIQGTIGDDDAFSLDSVTFQNHLDMRPDPTTTNWNPAPWTGPHWVKNQPAATLPVAYACTENAKMSCEAAVSGATDSTCGYQLRAVWKYGGETFTTPWELFTPSYYGENVSVTFSDTFRNIFKGQQAYYADNFTLSWEFKIVGEDTVREIDDSVNPLYVTYDAPSTSNLYHTVVHTGCAAASGKNTEIEVFHATWGKFTSRNIKEVNVVNGAVVEGEMLSYYGKAPENVASIPTIKTRLSVHDTGFGILHNYVATQFPSRAREYDLQYGNTTKTGTEILLVAHDGTCGFWQDFAVQVFNCQGLEVVEHVISADQYDGFKVLGELRGQGGGVPLENIWYNHAVIQYENWILDPSYGVSYGTYDIAAQSFITTALESVGENLRLEPDEYLGYGSAYKGKEEAGSIEIDDLYFSWL